MINSTQIQYDLTATYDRQRFVSLLADFFPNDFEKKIEPITEVSFNTDYVTSITRLGECSTFGIKMFEIHHNSKRDARVGVTKEAFNLLAEERCQRALISFIPDNDTSGQYRFSLVQVELEAIGSKVKRKYSNPRRCSFILGKDIVHNTPQKFLLDKGRIESIEDLKERFSVDALTKEFYNDIFGWYLWALSDDNGFKVTYPNDTATEADDRIIEEHLLRLIIRLMFVWFIKQKKLVPDEIFDQEQLRSILKNFIPTSKKDGNYYNAILQNLFFATLNRPIDERDFAVEGGDRWNENYGIKTLYRDAMEDTYFNKTHEQIIALFKRVPFLNGGLFECLDKEQDDNGKIFYYDGFSRAKGKQKRAFVPNVLFFKEERGLLHIFKRYNFTIEENTLTDAVVSLDPELLGKIFENLLGYYNPETQQSARKSTGSFYTPREIVDYMVDESIYAYLKQAVGDNWKEQKVKTYLALTQIKVLDPACGSGAFPMGILNRIVSIIEENELSKDKIYEIKRNLIEKCIYGVDIQSIAVQISKLRFFISLIIDQTPDWNKPNFGMLPLPNLETKFVVANTLIGIQRKEGRLESTEVDDIREELRRVRAAHFSAKTAKQKKELRSKDKELRNNLAKLLKDNFAEKDIRQLAQWNPYDQNTHSQWFDAEWMFGVTEGFDVVIGNPPYIDSETMTNIGLEWERKFIVKNFKYISGNWDIYMAFFEKGLDLSENILCYITPDKWLSKPFGQKFREFCMIPKMNKIARVGSNVFENVRVDGIISLFVQNSENLITLKFGNTKEIKTIATTNKNEIDKPYLIDYLFSENSALINKIEKSVSKKIFDFAICEGACATSDAYNLVPFVENNNDFNENDYFKLINTGTIEKYGNRWGTKEIIYLGKKLLFPIVSRQKFTENFGKSYVSKAIKPKVIFKGLNLLDACIDFKGNILPAKSTLVICSENSDLLKYLCAIINSRLSMFYIKNKYASSSYCGGITFTKDMINNFPITDVQQPLIALVEQILQSKEQNADTSALEKKIDKLVYGLYGLTKEEIKVVET
ncbi:MAG: Eco57I restriction-modification methylase domain-containing protein [Ignavibacteria bacterium]|jgi:hypothetical protein|nr:Eco57I restriction-modification methylase domain-containing protein [Ignavibacteria bacterium]